MHKREEDLPEDMMVVLIANQKQRDAIMKHQRENARKLLDEKQRLAKEQADLRRQERLKGVTADEDLERRAAARHSAEAFLIKLQKRRKAREGQLTQGQKEAMSMMSQKHKKRVQTEEHKQALQKTVEKFNRNCYSKKAGNQQMLLEMLKQPKDEN